MDIPSVLLTFSLTVLGGVATFVAGQFAITLFLEPIQTQRRTIGAIHHSLMFYRNKYLGPQVFSSEDKLELSKHLRDQASSLVANTNAIPSYGFFSRLGFVLRRKDVLEASRSMFILTHFEDTTHVDAFEKSNNVAKLLKLDLV